MGDVRDIRSARTAAPELGEEGMFANPLGDVRELVGVAGELGSEPMVTLNRPPPDCEGWSLTPGQAAALAEALMDASRFCRGGGVLRE
jgi:hypothetical protein